MLGYGVLLTTQSSTALVCLYTTDNDVPNTSKRSESLSRVREWSPILLKCQKMPPTNQPTRQLTGNSLVKRREVSQGSFCCQERMEFHSTLLLLLLLLLLLGRFCARAGQLTNPLAGQTYPLSKLFPIHICFPNGFLTEQHTLHFLLD